MVQIYRIVKILQTDVASAANVSSSQQNLFSNLDDPSFESVNWNDLYKDLHNKFDQLNETVKAFATGGDNQKEGVEIGTMTFGTREDLKIWVTDQIEIDNEDETSPFPFGVFLDVYSFLARIQTQADTKDPMLKNLDLNQRTKLTSDEVTTLAAFTNMVPSIFGRSTGNSALSFTKKSFLPAMREKADWETPSRDREIKRIIEEQIKNVLCQMRGLISSRLQGRSEAIMLATTCLSLSQAFVIDLSRLYRILIVT